MSQSPIVPVLAVGASVLGLLALGAGYAVWRGPPPARTASASSVAPQVVATSARATWAKEAATILASPSGGTPDPSCSRFACSTHRTSVGDVTRAQSNGNPEAVRLSLPSVRLADAGPSQRISCESSRRLYLIDAGPLVGNVLALGPSTILATPAYFLATSESGFGAAERACVLARFR